MTATAQTLPEIIEGVYCAVEADDAALADAVIAAIKTIFDPEIPVNIWELGLIYSITVAKGDVKVLMTLTAPACPVAGTLPAEVETQILGVQGVTAASVELVWEPAWDQSRMSEEAKLELGLF